MLWNCGMRPGFDLLWNMQTLFWSCWDLSTGPGSQLANTSCGCQNPERPHCLCVGFVPTGLQNIFSDRSGQTTRGQHIGPLWPLFMFATACLEALEAQVIIWTQIRFQHACDLCIFVDWMVSITSLPLTLSAGRI